MYIYKEKQLKTKTMVEPEWVVIATDENGQEIIIAKVLQSVRYPKAVAIAISDSLNRNNKLTLVDLV